MSINLYTSGGCGFICKVEAEIDFVGNASVDGLVSLVALKVAEKDAIFAVVLDDDVVILAVVLLTL